MSRKIVIGSRHGGHAASIPIIKDILDEEFEDPEYIVLTDPQDYLEYDFAKKVYKTPGFRYTGQDKAVQPINLLRNIYSSLKILVLDRPQTVVAAGANTSFPLGLFGGLLFRKEVIAVEAKNRTVNPSKTPKVLSKLSKCKVWVSHDSILDQYESDRVENKQILQRQDYTNHRSEDRTEEIMVVPSSGDSEEIKKKYGKNLPHEEFLDLMGKTKTVITRAGNTAYEASQLADKVVVVPFPDPQNHQDNFADWLEKEYENVNVIRDKDFSEVIEENEE